MSRRSGWMGVALIVALILGPLAGAGAVFVVWCAVTGAALGVLVQPKRCALVASKAQVLLRVFALTVGVYCVGRAYPFFSQLPMSQRPYVCVLAFTALVCMATFTFRDRLGAAPLPPRTG